MGNLLLHAGCGTAKLPGEFSEKYEERRLDIDPSCKPDWIASITDLSSIIIPNGHRYAFVLCCHTLEHLYAHEVPLALAEFHRVLEPGGQLRIEVPDLQFLGKYLAEDRIEDVIADTMDGPVSALDALYGIRPAIEQGQVLMAHRTGFTAKTMRKRLIEAGFVFVNTWSNLPGNLVARGFKPKEKQNV